MSRPVEQHPGDSDSDLDAELVAPVKQRPTGRLTCHAIRTEASQQWNARSSIRTPLIQFVEPRLQPRQ